jgi:hypothetical protein
MMECPNAYTYGHSSPEMESLEKSPAAFNAHVATAPTELCFIDAGVNISLEAHRSAFLPGSYTWLRTPIDVKGIDVDIHGYGLVEPHLVYEDGHIRLLRIRAAHAPVMSKRGAPTIISQKHPRNRHKISFHYHVIGQPFANDPHGNLVLCMHNNLPHLQTLPGEYTSLLAYKDVGPTPTGTILWHQRIGNLGRDTMTLALKSVKLWCHV